MGYAADELVQREYRVRGKHQHTTSFDLHGNNGTRLIAFIHQVFSHFLQLGVKGQLNVIAWQRINIFQKLLLKSPGIDL